MTERTVNCKRKAADDAAPLYYRQTIVPPMFISLKMMRRSRAIQIPPRPITPMAERSTEASFTSLPREIFCNIIAYLGPTSSSLCTLSQVTRDHNSIMTSIGDVMLNRANLRFRVPLPPMNSSESSTSRFVRHARVSKAVHDNLEHLNEVLNKNFPTISTTLTLEDTTKIPLELGLMKISHSTSHSSETVEPSEVNNALNIALCLLGCPKQDYFGDPHEAQRIAMNAATTALEWRVSSLCCKLGAKAYKYAKSRMCRQYEHEDELFSAFAVTDNMPLEDDSDYDDDDDLSLESIEIEADEDLSILDKASLVMQYVVIREQQKARQLGRASTTTIRDH